MANESRQHTLDRVRAPRVQITYDVEVGDAIEKKELPFVTGVVGDFTGHPVEPLAKLKDRKFVNIDRDNFNEVLKGMTPHLGYRVDNTLDENGSQLSIDLNFQSITDFEPANVASQVEPLRRLMEVRSKLSDLKNKMYSNERLGEILQEILNDTEKLETLGEETSSGDAEESKE